MAGCTGSGQVSYSGQAVATTTTPNLVEVSPGVQVIADADEPVFYSDNYYWRQDNGVWMRSHSHMSGWERAEVVPTPIQTIERPSMYVHYRGGPRPQIVHNETTVIDPREPVVERHETTVVPETRHEQRKDIREDQKDAKEQRKDAKEERKDAKEQRKEDKRERKDRD